MKRLGKVISQIIEKDWKQFFLSLLIAWICLNFLQSFFTEIINDEAYYFLYGENLAWGYYDHPPMVGLMIFISKSLFGGNLSIRFMTILLQAATLFLCWKLIEEKLPDPKKVLLFFIISGSLVMFNAYGFFTTPDAPFLFFTALFLCGYKKFLEKESQTAIILMSASMAGLIYSKYHAVLVIGFVILSNLKILLRYKFWITCLLALILLAPHIYWQASMNFPSFKYHVNERTNGFEWIHFIKYIPNQMLVFNPVTFIAVVYVLIKHKASDVFERGLIFLILGFFCFFGALSLTRRVEPHWTVAASIPIILLLYHNSLRDGRLMQFVKKWVALSILLVLITRLVLPSGLLSEELGFTGKKKGCKEIESIAGDLPVVFTGSFQQASIYHFFTRKESLLLSASNSRQTQFDIWKKELEYQGRPVFIYGQIAGKSQQYKTGNRTVEGYFAKHFQSVNRVVIEYNLMQKEYFPGETLSVDIEIINPSGYDIDFQHPEFPVTCKVGYGIKPEKGKVEFFNCELNEPVNILPANGKVKRKLKAIVPRLAPNHYRFLLTLVNPVCAARNSLFTTIEIKERK